MRWMGVPDYLTEAGAHDLAERLSGYWDRRGAVVLTFICKCHTERSNAVLYCVRSTLHNGLPIEHPAAVRISNGSDAHAVAQAGRLEGTDALDNTGAVTTEAEADATGACIGHRRGA